jgi:hypothetical protein
MNYTVDSFQSEGDLLFEAARMLAADYHPTNQVSRETQIPAYLSTSPEAEDGEDKPYLSSI